jgi:hypothetical protein
VVELVDVIAAAWREHPWILVVAGAVQVSYLASLFMWRQLVVFFVVVFVLGVMGDNFATGIATITGLTRHSTLIWQIWTMAVMGLYGLYLWKTKRPAQPIRPEQLL